MCRIRLFRTSSIKPIIILPVFVNLKVVHSGIHQAAATSFADRSRLRILWISPGCCGRVCRTPPSTGRGTSGYRPRTADVHRSAQCRSFSGKVYTPRYDRTTHRQSWRPRTRPGGWPAPRRRSGNTTAWSDRTPETRIRIEYRKAFSQMDSVGAEDSRAMWKVFS